MKLDEFWKILQWLWKWYPAFWKQIISDDPFRSVAVTRWRNSWMTLTGLAVIFGWWKVPAARSGLLACGEICVFGLVGLAFLGWLIRIYPLADDYPAWKPVMALVVYIWAPYLVPWSLHRFDAFINDHWRKSIEAYILATDPGFTWKAGLINSVPYCVFTLAGALMISVCRHRRSTPLVETQEE